MVSTSAGKKVVAPDPRLSVAFSAIFGDPEAQMWAQKQQHQQKHMVREGFGTCFRKKCTVHGLKVENIRASLCLSFETESDQSFEGMTARNCNRNNMLARM